MARWIRRRDKTGRVLVIANQKPGVLDRYGLSREDVDRTAWIVDSSGHRLEGAAAVNRVLRELGGVWPHLASAFRLEPVAATEEMVYRWFARNRTRFRRFGVRPECEEPGSDCI
jgi:predicted DCC family thiol-disulfide oxidoreductase YuxK